MPTIPGVWRKGTTELRLVASRDAGRTWQRVAGRQVWLPHHRDDDGYDRRVFGARPVPVGDEDWFYYPAWDGDHLTFNRDGTTYYPRRMRVGRTALAVLRHDGYVSLDAADEPAELVTHPLRFVGDELTVNLRAPAGRLRAEVQDPAGDALAGFALADCEPVRGDGVALGVRWRGGRRAGDVAGQTVRLRLEWTRGALYALRFAPAG
jgi:hypothetical protein